VRSSTLELEKLLRSSLLVHAHARERLAFIVAHACKSSALIVPVIVAHSRKVRGLITLKLRNVLRLTMLIATVRIPTTYPHLRV
jgi:hypothetical protein